MRILALNWRDPHNPEAGGAEIHLHEILKRAVKAGHEVIHVSHAIQWLPDKEVIDGVQIHRYGKWYSYNFTLKKYCKSLDLDSFDLIIEDICKVPVFSPRWSNTPVLAIVPHLFGTTAYREVSASKAIYVNILEAMIPCVYGKNNFVAISDSTKNDLVRRGIPVDRISVIPCGIDTDFYKQNTDIEPEKGRLLFVGRLKKYKGVQHLLKAMKILQSRNILTNLTVIGEGDYSHALKLLVGKLNLQDRVSFEGFIPQEDKLLWLQKAYVAVFPSAKEGWGLTVIEANCCGTPVVASDSDGLRDSVKNGKTGILVKHEDPLALADALESIVISPEKRAEFSKHALSWAKSFNWDYTGEKMLEVMDMTVREHKEAEKIPKKRRQ
ncbi:MAG: glycosyltransferase family 4 protein [Candidatus Sabulitectum sp.]|nr:glycosyltransferase family 4 protein [Candidatus Sabulitectum sp.]